MKKMTREEFEKSTLADLGFEVDIYGHITQCGTQLYMNDRTFSAEDMDIEIIPDRPEIPPLTQDNLEKFLQLFHIFPEVAIRDDILRDRHTRVTTILKDGNTIYTMDGFECKVPMCTLIDTRWTWENLGDNK